MIYTTEIDKLEELIKGVPLMRNCCRRRQIFDGWQIQFLNPANGFIISDVVCHRYSYGGLSGLLEQQGLLPEYVDDDIEGWLTAEKVFERWKKHFDEKVIPF